MYLYQGDDLLSPTTCIRDIGRGGLLRFMLALINSKQFDKKNISILLYVVIPFYKMIAILELWKMSEIMIVFTSQKYTDLISTAVQHLFKDLKTEEVLEFKKLCPTLYKKHICQ